MTAPVQHDGSVSASPTEPPSRDVLTELDAATNRLVLTVDGLPDEAYREPSGLPGWSRAHVVAHLALNAESLSGVLESVSAGSEGAMYPSVGRRGADIEQLAAASPGELRERLLGSIRTFSDTVAQVPSRGWSGSFRRDPSAEVLLPATRVVDMRHREVEIHHADLEVDYGPADWPGSFAARTIDALRARAPRATLLATDLGRTWHADPVRVTVSGTAPLLAWWLSGRGDGESLTSNSGDLPRIEEW